MYNRVYEYFLKYQIRHTHNKRRPDRSIVGHRNADQIT